MAIDRALRSSPAHADAITASLEIASERGGDLTARVYELLFTREPTLRDQFWRDSDGAIKGEMLMKVFEAILDFVGERRYADFLIEAEAMNHEGFAVPRTVFATFFGIVAEVVQDACGAQWSGAMEEAWRQTLADLDYHVGIRKRLAG